MTAEGVSLPVPDALVERIAARAVELLAEQHQPPEPELLTVAEAANYLRCGKQRVYDLVSQGRLPCLKDGSRVLIRRGELLAYLNERKA